MYNLSRFCCQNPKCADYGKRGAGNLSANKPYGKGKMQRLLYCRTCKRWFSARKGTVFFGRPCSVGFAYGYSYSIPTGSRIKQRTFATKTVCRFRDMHPQKGLARKAPGSCRPEA
jgi:hypothetical protein